MNLTRKEIKLALVYRDMWQSSGKYVPRVDQLEQVADPIIQMGCFYRVETNGGGFEQVNLLFGENPNHSVRKWTRAFNKAGIKTQMLERGLNALRMSPVPADVRRLMFHVKKKQGTDISRSFDGLNNPQNLSLSFQYAKEAGMIAQGALSITHSPLHTVDYFIQLADQYIDLGAEEICVKDMAGVGRPASIGKIIHGIRQRHPNITIQYHGHSTPGFSVATSLEAARSGVDIIDVGMEPLSFGTGHADLLTIHAMLTDAGFQVDDIDMKAYMEVRSLTQSFIDDFLGYYINPINRHTLPLLIGSGLPGGMMGSLMSDLEKNLESLNRWIEKNDKSILTQDDLLIKLFEEVEYVWPRMGYPPLVTPFSQYVKNAALMNVIQMEKGNERWSMIDENTWSMILGNTGQLPGEIGSELKELADKQGRTFYHGNPQELYPDELEKYKTIMKEKGWETGPDEEELMQFAMHPRQYEDFKTGKAKEKFNEDLQKRRKAATDISQNQSSPVERKNTYPQEMKIEVNGKNYHVVVSYPEQEKIREKNSPQDSTTSGSLSNGKIKDNETYKYITAPLEGKFYLTKESSEQPIQVGDRVNKGDTVAYIESMKVINAITADKEGTVVSIIAVHGAEIDEDEKLIKLS
ncbi:MAG TPA: oxaloacetate decarboxylase [Saprospiraceae bacterium]|nr:oxaloacetate decarboxylase [Saprospiraceae bacterium]